MHLPPPARCCRVAWLAWDQYQPGLMVAVTIYTTSTCPYCHAAKQLLAERGTPFTEIDVTGNRQERARLVERTGQYTVPQVFLDDTSIGGYEELAALDQSGELDRLLASP
jgi:glutaredoxin 3